MKSTAPPQQIAPGVHRWATTHPEWHPGEFGAEVVSFAVTLGSGTLLIDPLVPGSAADGAGGDEAFLADLDRIVSGEVTIAITIPYHVRSGPALAARYEATIHGHIGCLKRPLGKARFRELVVGELVEPGFAAQRIGNPRRNELPLYLPQQRALVFGDAVVEVGGELRVWLQKPVAETEMRWYRERFVPSLEPLLELDFDRVLNTHGESFLGGGKKRLAEALTGEPWYHRG